MGKRGEVLQAEMLDIMHRHAGPHSAYDLLRELRKTNAKMAPPTVYRALAVLMEKGRIHRLESLNAYIPCQCDSHEHASVLAICDDCGAVNENVAPGLLSKLASVLGKSGFAAQRHIIEVHGLCATCQPEQAAT